MENIKKISLRFMQNRADNEEYKQALEEGYEEVSISFDPLTQGTIIIMEKKNGKV